MDNKLLEKFLALLLKWNKAYNLTAIDEPEKIITHHVNDSLSVAPFIKGDRVIDVGTGPGFPGVPLALTFPQKHFTLVDSNGKKTRFLVQVKSELGLENVEIVQSRIEDYQPEAGFDVIISRAFSSISEFISLTQHLCRQNGRWLAMKGKYPAEELKTLDMPYEAHKLTVSGLEAARYLIEIQPQI